MVKKIKIDNLNKRTRTNLEKLETKGFKFNKTGEYKLVPQFNTGGKPTGIAKSIDIRGKDPKGRKIIYHRRETRSRAAGQTYLSTPVGRVRVSDMLNGKTRPHTQTNLKAAEHYGLIVKNR